MLTRHLYRYDEVKSSLVYSIIIQRSQEGLFWSMELLDSLCSEDVLAACFRAWIMCMSWSSFGYFPLFETLLKEEELDPMRLIEFVITLLREKERDASVYGLLLKGSIVEKQPDRVVPMKLSDEQELLNEKEKCLIRAIYQKKILLAWCLLRNRWTEESTWTLLESLCTPYQKSTFERLKKFPLFTPSLVWEQRALCLLCLCSEKKAFAEKVSKPLSAELLLNYKEWTELEGRRARRVFKIPLEAILWGTSRSLQPNTHTNFEELYDPRHSLRGVPYWEEVANSMGSWKHIHKVDDMKEAFYDLYFPDDIPDEWSYKDQEKSHGYGLLIGTNIANQQYKGMRALLSNIPTLGLVSFTQDAIRTYCWDYQTFEEAYEKRNQIQEWDYAPIKKRILIKKMK